MKTKIVMTSSAIFLGVIGILLSFLPSEIITYLGVEPTIITTLFLKILSALYLGSGILNWMAKGSIIGGIYNKYELEVVRSNAFSYFHGHSVGGTNPSLLEAMASKNICICHDNEFNNGVVNDSGFYFKTIQDVSDIIQVIERNDYSHYGNEVFEKVKNYFNWGNIVKLYADYFKEIIK